MRINETMIFVVIYNIFPDPSVIGMFPFNTIANKTEKQRNIKVSPIKYNFPLKLIAHSPSQTLVPHSGQNFAPVARTVLQFGHLSSIGLPQFEQNFTLIGI